MNFTYLLFSSVIKIENETVEMFQQDVYAIDRGGQDQVAAAAVAQAVLTNNKHGDYSTIFDVESDRGADGPCVLKFSFQCNNTHVLVNYKGPVRFGDSIVKVLDGWFAAVRNGSSQQWRKLKFHCKIYI